MQYFGALKLTFPVLVSCKYELPVILLSGTIFGKSKADQVCVY